MIELEFKLREIIALINGKFYTKFSNFLHPRRLLVNSSELKFHLTLAISHQTCSLTSFQGNFPTNSHVEIILVSYEKFSFHQKSKINFHQSRMKHNFVEQLSTEFLFPSTNNYFNEDQPITNLSSFPSSFFFTTSR